MRRLSLIRGCAFLLIVGGVMGSQPLAALDTPLVLTSGSNTGIIDPGLGTITTIEFLESGSTRKNFCNWLFDLQRNERTIIGMRDDEIFSALRTGSLTVKPSAEDFIRLYSDKPTKKQAELGQKALQMQVREAEKMFWAKPLPYDGQVRGAFAGEYLMLVIPAKRVALFYRTTGRENVELIGISNFSPLLYIQTAWKSEPNPAELVKSLQLDEHEKKSIEGALAAKEDGSAPQAANCDVWCTAVGPVFIVVDSANNKIWSYEINSQKNIQVTSVRSLAVDLLAPGYKTYPLDQVAVDAFAKTYGQLLHNLGIDRLDLPYLKAMLGAFRVGDSAKAGALQANTAGDQVVLSFTALNKILAYTYRGGAGLELATVRDVTVDQGLTLIARMAQEQIDARKFFESAVLLAAKHQAVPCLSSLTQALTYDPTLHIEAEKNSNLKSELKADWEKLMATSTQAAVELMAKREAVLKAAAAERERLLKLKNSPR